MSLMITELQFLHFRNYEALRLCDIEPITIFVGPNAVGKTNIIEGIQLLTALTSFRSHPIEYLIQNENDQASLSMNVHDKKEDRLLTVSLLLEKGKKKYKLNGKGKRPSDLQGVLPSVIFTPDDLNLIKGSGSLRRNFIDDIGCQLSKNYASIKKDFDTSLKQKNQLLKEDFPLDFLESIDEVFIKCSAQLSCYRMALIRKIIPYINEIYSSISGSKEDFSLQYVPSWEKEFIDSWKSKSKDTVEEITPGEARNLLRNTIQANRSQEKIRQHALYGAHADKIDFFLNGKNATDFASQGQQRSIVLAMKLAEVSLIEELLHQRPVLLLDDVMSELDKERRDALISCVKKSTQVFITTTNLSYFENSLLSSVKPIQLPLS